MTRLQIQEPAAICNGGPIVALEVATRRAIAPTFGEAWHAFYVRVKVGFCCSQAVVHFGNARFHIVE